MDKSLQKIQKELDKLTLDNQIEVFHKIKEYINQKINERTDQIESEKERYLNIQEKL